MLDENQPHDFSPRLLESLRVLIVDDSATVRRSAANLLTRLGCQVVQAADGFEALWRLVEHAPDVVFIDVMMPRLDGYATCQLVKHHPEFARTPVVLLSGNESLFDQARGFLSGADDYLIKPFTQDSLLRSLATCSVSSPVPQAGVSYVH